MRDPAAGVAPWRAVAQDGDDAGLGPARQQLLIRRRRRQQQVARVSRLQLVEHARSLLCTQRASVAPKEAEAVAPQVSILSNELLRELPSVEPAPTLVAHILGIELRCRLCNPLLCFARFLGHDYRSEAWPPARNRRNGGHRQVASDQAGGHDPRGGGQAAVQHARSTLASLEII